MTETRKTEFLKHILSHAGQLAYVEDATATFDMLEKLNIFFRYITAKTSSVMLKEETAAAESYIALQKLCNPTRFSIAFATDLESDEIFIRRCGLIDMLDDFMRCVLESDGFLQDYRIAFKPHDDSVIVRIERIATGELLAEKALS